MDKDPDDYRTPDQLFNTLNKQFGPFNLDVAANADNSKCDNFLDRQTNGLEAKWNGNVWCNPPYGRDMIKWVKKAIHEIKNNDTVDSITMLIPIRSNSNYFHNLIMTNIDSLVFVKGRLKFGGPNTQGKTKGSMFYPGVFVFKKKDSNLPGIIKLYGIDGDGNLRKFGDSGPIIRETEDN